MTTAITKIQDSMLRLDEIAANSALISGQLSPFSQAITMAEAIKEIRASLTNEVMQTAIMPLMNTKLGFRTDKDPSRPVWKKDPKTSKWSEVVPEPYSVEIVRECLIEATLRGVPPVGNCWNIISSQAYITKEGFWHLIGKKIAGISDFKISIGVPKMVKPAGDARNASDEEAKGATVNCVAIWKLHGREDRVEREIPIRVNAQMGADAIMGKAERKLLAAAYAQITGTVLSDADATEAETPLLMPEGSSSKPKVLVSQDKQINPFAGTALEVDEPASEPEQPAPSAPPREEASPEDVTQIVECKFDSVAKKSKPREDGGETTWHELKVITRGKIVTFYTFSQTLGERLGGLKKGAELSLSVKPSRNGNFTITDYTLAVEKGGLI